MTKKITLVEIMIVIAIIGIIASMIIPALNSPSYLLRSKWANAISSISDLKTAINQCLIAEKGKHEMCNSISQLNKYGVNAMPVIADSVGKVEISSVENYPLTIVISGNKELVGCNYAFVPIIDAAFTNVAWIPALVNSSGATEKECLNLIKNAQKLSSSLVIQKPEQPKSEEYSLSAENVKMTETIEKIKQGQQQYKQCIESEKQKVDTAKQNMQQAVKLVFKICEPELTKLHQIYINGNIPQAIIDRHFEKLQTEAKNSLLQASPR